MRAALHRGSLGHLEPQAQNRARLGGTRLEGEAFGTMRGTLTSPLVAARPESTIGPTATCPVLEGLHVANSTAAVRPIAPRTFRRLS